MVEGARLESVCAGNRTVGSNPILSARKNMELFQEEKIITDTEKSYAGAFLLSLRVVWKRHIKDLTWCVVMCYNGLGEN